MKNLLLLALIFTVACSKNNPNNNSSPQPDQQIIMEMAPERIDLSVVNNVLTGIIVNADSLDFGDVLVGAKATKKVTLLAKTAIPQLDTSGFQNSTNFKVIANNCGTSLSTLRSCTLDLEYSPTIAGIVSELMSLNNSLNFVVKANALPAAPLPQPADFAELLTVTPAIDLGVFTGLKKTGRVTILNRNRSDTEIVIDASLIEAQGFSYISYCPASPLKLRYLRSCQIEVSYMSAVKKLQTLLNRLT